MTFDEAFEKVIGHEGNYVNDPRDPGGETKFGISKRAYPKLNIYNLTLQDAKDIYKRDYWVPCKCDQLPGWITFHMLDAAINSGIKQAVMWLQRAAGATPDGVIGARTIAMVREADPGRTIGRFYGQRLDLITNLKIWNSHGRGLVKRVAQNLMES